MNGTTTFTDILKKSFVSLNVFQKIAVADVLICLSFGIATGLLIYAVYRYTFRGVVYSRTFNVSLVLMCVLTALIILTISSNVVLSLGMVGALSIVRFRTAIKDPVDIMFLFWAVTGGIATGAGAYSVSIVGSVVIGLLMLILLQTRSKGRMYLLLVHHDEAADEQVRLVLANLRHVLKSRTLSQGRTELNVEIRVTGDNTAFLRQLSEIEGVTSASLVSYNGEYAE